MKLKLLLFLALTLISPLKAQSFETVFNGLGPSLTATGSFDGGKTYKAQPGGLLNFDFSFGFCVEPTQYLYAGESMIFEVKATEALVNSEALGRIYWSFLQGNQTPLDAAGAQWAIWEICKDGSRALDLSSGHVRLQDLKSQVAVRAQEYLSNTHSGGYLEGMVYATNPERQNVLFQCPQVPEPGYLPLLLIGTVLLFYQHRSETRELDRQLRLK